MDKKKAVLRKKSKMTRKELGIILAIGFGVLVAIAIIGYVAWNYYYWLPSNVADRFLGAYAVYDWPKMAANADGAFIKEWESYYKPIYEAYADLRGRIAEGKGLPVGAVDSPIRMEIPSVKEWKLHKTATAYIYTYTGTIDITFPGSPTHSFSRVSLKVDWSLGVDRNFHRVAWFERRASTPDWAVYRFLEARMTLNEDYVKDTICPNAIDSGLDHYLGEYSLDIANLQANVHWIVSHISSFTVDGEHAVLYYGLWKVGGVDSPESIPKWLYLPVKEKDTLCNVSGVWYIKDIMFEQQSQ